MQQNTFTCSKCHNNYPIQSKVMHELHCTGSSNVPQHQIPLQQPLYHPQPQIVINTHIPYQPHSQPPAHSTHEITILQNGYLTEKIEEISGNMKTVTIIIRDPNGNIVSQQMSTQSIGGGGNNNVNMFNGMPMQMNLPTGSRLNFGSSPLHNPFYSHMINNQNNVEAFLEQINQPAQHPVPDTIVNELPEITIDSVDKLDGDKKDCTICLNSFKHGDKALILPCIHIFHTDCIKKWFKTQNTCPICKFKMDANSLNN